MLAKIIMVGNLVFYKSLAAKLAVDAPKTKPSARNEQKETRYETH